MSEWKVWPLSRASPCCLKNAKNCALLVDIIELGCLLAAEIYIIYIWLTGHFPYIFEQNEYSFIEYSSAMAVDLLLACINLYGLIQVIYAKSI